MEEKKLQEEETRELSLKEVLLCFWNNKWPILAITTACGIAALLITMYLIQPKYQATIRLYVNNRTESTNSVNSSDITAAQSLVNTYITIIQSDSALEDVISATSVSYEPAELKKMITAKAVNNTEVFSVSVTGTDPEKCAVIANAIAKIAPDKIATIVEGSSVRVIDYAKTPLLPVAPSKSKNTVISAILGFIIAYLIYIVIYLSDTTISDESDIKDFCTLPILGIISDFEQKKSEKYGYSKSDYYARKAENQ